LKKTKKEEEEEEDSRMTYHERLVAAQRGQSKEEMRGVELQSFRASGIEHLRTEAIY